MKRRADILDASVAEALLAVLATAWPNGGFDASSISFAASGEPLLMQALAPFEPRLERRYSFLTCRSRLRVERWLEANDGQQFGDLRLESDRFGWFSVLPVKGVCHGR